MTLCDVEFVLNKITLKVMLTVSYSQRKLTSHDLYLLVLLQTAQTMPCQFLVVPDAGEAVKIQDINLTNRLLTVKNNVKQKLQG